VLETVESGGNIHSNVPVVIVNVGEYAKIVLSASLMIKMLYAVDVEAEAGTSHAQLPADALTPVAIVDT